MTTSPSASTTERIGSLRPDLIDRLFVPGDDRYDAARAVFGGFDRRPAAIVRVADESDVPRVPGSPARRERSSPCAAAHGPPSPNT